MEHKTGSVSRLQSNSLNMNSNSSLKKTRWKFVRALFLIAAAIVLIRLYSLYLEVYTSRLSFSKFSTIETPFRDKLLTSFGVMKQDEHYFEPMCIKGTSDELDSWLETHSDWHVINDTLNREMCVRRDTSLRALFFLQLQNLQSQSCDKVLVMKQINSGWAADFNTILFSLLASIMLNQPLHAKWKLGWHYSALLHVAEDHGKTVVPGYDTCPARDLSCYFLEFSKCRVEAEEKNAIKWEDLVSLSEANKISDRLLDFAYKANLDSLKFRSKLNWPKSFSDAIANLRTLRTKVGLDSRQFYRALLYDFITRPKQEIRVKLSKITRSIEARLNPGKCAVMHVRRGDSKILKGWYRQYHNISEYLELGNPYMTERGITQVLLLTDSSEAIHEAKTQFPEIDWVYFNRSRFKADEGGFESQLPSKSPELETLYLLATMQVVQKCPVLVKSNSHLSHLMYTMMCAGESSWRYPEGPKPPEESWKTLECPDTVIVGANDHEVVKQRLQKIKAEQTGEFAEDERKKNSYCVKGTSSELDAWLTKNPDYFIESETLNEVMCVVKDESLRGKFYRALTEIQEEVCVNGLVINLGGVEKVVQPHDYSHHIANNWAEVAGLAINAFSYGIVYSSPVHLKNEMTLGYLSSPSGRLDTKNGECSISSGFSCYFLPSTTCKVQRNKVLNSTAYAESSTAEGVVRVIHERRWDYEGTNYIKGAEKKILLNKLQAFRGNHEMNSVLFYSSLLYDFVFRPRQEFRIQVAEKIHELEGKLQKCAVMYFPPDDLPDSAKLSAFVAAGLPDMKKRKIQQVLLLSDNNNLEEIAYKRYPDIDWVSFNRARFKTDMKVGHFHSSVKTNSSRIDAIYHAASLQLVKRCREGVFVHEDPPNHMSFFSDLIYAQMCGFASYFSPGSKNLENYHPSCPVHAHVDPVAIEKVVREEGVQEVKIESIDKPLRASLNQMDKHAKRNPNDIVCLRGTSEELDRWLSLNPEWFPVSDTLNVDMCVKQDKSIRTEFFRELHKTQYNPNRCKMSVPVKMINSGWAADFNLMTWALSTGYIANKPISFKPRDAWHYTALMEELPSGKKVVSDHSASACKSVDLNCYFLPVSICPHSKYLPPIPFDDFVQTNFKNKNKTKDNVLLVAYHKQWDDESLQSLIPNGSMRKLLNKAKIFRTSKGISAKNFYSALLYDYISRPKQEFRVQIAAKVAELDHLQRGKCAVMHVRRGDVKIMVGWFRKYHNVSEYVEAGKPFMEKRGIKQIFLLTDSGLVIEEAEKGFPQYEWIYFKRERYKADEGGFENQLPSNSPRIESTYLAATMELVKRCSVIMKSNSHLSHLMHWMMCAGRKMYDGSDGTEDYECPDRIVVGKTDHEDLLAKFEAAAGVEVSN